MKNQSNLDSLYTQAENFIMRSHWSHDAYTNRRWVHWTLMHKSGNYKTRINRRRYNLTLTDIFESFGLTLLYLLTNDLPEMLPYQIDPPQKYET